jgi:serine/threonine kinase 3
MSLAQSGTARNKFSTMIINEDEESVCEPTMQRHDTVLAHNAQNTYVPLFIEHFKQEEESQLQRVGQRKTAEDQRDLSSPAQVQLAPAIQKTYQPIRASAAPHPFVESDFDFLRFLSYDELHLRMGNLDGEMEEEFEDLRRRYQAKRKPILQAIESKKARQLDIWPDSQ